MITDPYIAVPYAVVMAVVWRSMTGHMAWSVHRTAKHNPTVRPPIENWVACSIPCFCLAAVWPITLLFIMRWPRGFMRGAELEAEDELHGVALAERGAALKELALKNELDFQALTRGEVVDE